MSGFSEKRDFTNYKDLGVSLGDSVQRRRSSAFSYEVGGFS